MQRALICGLLALCLGGVIFSTAAAPLDPMQVEASDTIFADGFDIAYFVMPYAADGSLPPSPTSRETALSTQIQKADVAFLVDTTGSMTSEVTALKNSFSSIIAPSLSMKIPSLGVGVAGHDDVPYGAYGTNTGGCLDLPYDAYEPQGYLTTSTSSSQSAINALTIHCGGDDPGSQVLAIHHAITGAAITWPTGSVLAEFPPDGTFGALRFRADALPIIINITNFAHHNGGRALDFAGTNYATGQNPYSFSTWDEFDAVGAMNNVGAKFIGITAGTRTTGVNDAYGYAAYFSDMTGSLLTTNSFTHGASCPATQCCTGSGGAGVAPDGPGGTCRSVFTVSTTGTGLATAVVSGVDALLNSVTYNMTVQAYNDPSETTDVVGNFILKVEPDPSGGTDPVTGSVCATFPAAQLADNFTGPEGLVSAPDGVNDTIKFSNPGPQYCFKITPKANTAVAATNSTQIFRAWIRVVADIQPGSTIDLGMDREIYFLVPAIAH